MARFNPNYGPAGSSFSKSAIPGYDLAKVSNVTPQQMDLYKLILGGVQPNLSPGLSFLGKQASGSPEAFESIEQPAISQFQGLLGEIGSRFSGMGSGARHSSGFNLASAEAGSDLAQKLQSQRLGLQRQALMDLLGLSQNLIGTDLESSFLLPKKKSGLMELLQGLFSGLGSGGAQAIGSSFL